MAMLDLLRPAELRRPTPEAMAAFVSPARRFQVVGVLLALGILADLTSTAFELTEFGLLRDIARGDVPSFETLAGYESRERVLGIVSLLTFSSGAIAFLFWLSRAYDNLSSLSTRATTHSRGWAIGSWFVPFLNWVRPFQIVKEMWWISSDPDGAAQAPSGHVPSAPALLRWWWGFWLFINLLSQAFRATRGAQSLDALTGVLYLKILSDIATVIAAILAIQVVREITYQQEMAARALSVISSQAVRP